MSSTLPDNRLRFQPATIDFTNQVGLTGQNHDNYPAPNTQARYDWMRMCIIALLSSQSSHLEPEEFRDGSLWFDLNTSTLKIRSNNDWRPISEVIEVSQNTGITLDNLYTQFLELTNRVIALEQRTQ